MGQRGVEESALVQEVARLRAEIEESRSRLTSDVIQLKGRIPLDMHSVMETSVQMVAGSAGTMIGTALNFSKRLFGAKPARR